MCVGTEINLGVILPGAGDELAKLRKWGEIMQMNWTLYSFEWNIQPSDATWMLENQSGGPS